MEQTRCRIAAIFAVLTMVFQALPACALEIDQEVLQAERTLRAAELRMNVDDTTLALYQKATEEAEAVLARNPNSAGANFVYFAALGRILLADGATKNLFTLRGLDKKYLDKAIALDPRYPNALAAKGGVLMDLPSLLGGDSDEGLRLLRRATEINPGGVGTRVAFAKALAQQGQVEEARKEGRRAAHLACVQGRRKAFGEATALLDELEAPVAKAALH